MVTILTNCLKRLLQKNCYFNLKTRQGIVAIVTYGPESLMMPSVEDLLPFSWVPCDGSF